ncbi:hypothetical protein [Chitinophaga pinensis]|uniref:Uncharacterized protein n=1 Tax=Chitinophaga pinensis (strain ATCC 43595 / DSM 2588 / LMG 13176 / NBRC 15968 / NCIMB 11800 / UQM 2034) TaxID=485918 RepID=A0A979GWI6_CHIPD|nr:hypothetical protein [Chitinophaga pinensis]ACU61791.1 hypothetical protein Cpin_4343 [Chitinophaga pinensis DSM 2588]
MTINDIYARLHSRTYYDRVEQFKFRFLNNALFIDRRAIIPIVIHMLDGVFYMQALKQIADESLFRLELNEDDIILYSTENECARWTLE